MCYGDKDAPIDGLLSCEEGFSNPSCDGDESGIPVQGLCYT